MNPLPGFATFGTAGFTADASSFSFKGAYVKGLANRHFAGIPNRNSIAALHESTHLRVRESSGDASTCGGGKCKACHSNEDWSGGGGEAGFFASASHDVRESGCALFFCARLSMSAKTQNKTPRWLDWRMDEMGRLALFVGSQSQKSNLEPPAVSNRGSLQSKKSLSLQSGFGKGQ